MEHANDNSARWSPAELRITEAQAERLRDHGPISHWSTALAERTERSLSERRMLSWRGQVVVANAKGKAALEIYDNRKTERRRNA